MLEDEVLALVRRYKHGNEYKDFLSNLIGHWQLKPALTRLIRAAILITPERYASPLDVHHSTRKYWSPFAGDSVFGAQHDCYSVAWNGCSQASPPSDNAEMDKSMRWAIASALTIEGPVMTALPPKETRPTRNRTPPSAYPDEVPPTRWSTPHTS